MLIVKKLHSQAKIPQREEGSVGYDFFSLEETIIGPGERKLIKTGIAIEFPELDDKKKDKKTIYGRLCDRSSMAYKYEIEICAGIIDNDYRGDIGFVMRNHGKNKYKIEKHQKIGQMIIESALIPTINESKILSETKRGDKGYGSTGK